MRRRVARAPTLALALALAVLLGAPGSVVASPAPGGSSPPFAVYAKVRLRPQAGADLVQAGTFSGTPLGLGRVVVRTRLNGLGGATVDFLMTNDGGSLRGSGTVAVTFKGTVVSYAGSARILSGTGDYASVRASHLRVQGSGSISGDTFSVAVTGS
jgi:hypothetical protein